jgi:hypothetical protein
VAAGRKQPQQAQADLAVTADYEYVHPDLRCSRVAVTQP